MTRTEERFVEKLNDISCKMEVLMAEYAMYAKGLKLEDSNILSMKQSVDKNFSQIQKMAREVWAQTNHMLEEA